MSVISPNGLKSIELATKLARHGCEKKVISEITGFSRKYYEAFWATPKHNHKSNLGYMQKSYGSKYLADRLFRLLNALFGEPMYGVIQAENLISAYESYVALYPQDEMSINRVYYTWLHINTREFSICECKDCGKPYLSKSVKLHSCGVCENKNRLLR